METNQRFTLMALPQFYNGTELTLNVVVLPRNQNPFAPAIEANVSIPDAPAFADAKLRFTARIISNLSTFPNTLAATHSVDLTTVSPSQGADVFLALAQQFKILNPNPSNASLDANPDRAALKAAVPAVQSVRKHLPLSYRHAFNFTSPRTPNASIDDAYSCALRGAGPHPGFTRSSDQVSWGKVFAFALRHPLLATQLGMIYSSVLPVDPSFFLHGGWLYVDLADTSDYASQEAADPTFIKRYAARIPPLDPKLPRQVFAPVLVPVLPKASSAAPDPSPDGNYDAVFAEMAQYDDGFAKIVHGIQPRSVHLMAEETDGAHPVKDAGIRLGWDDEQILLWYMRQLSIDASVIVAPDKRLDAALSVFGYAVDVREESTPVKAWESLNEVASNAPLQLTLTTAENQTDAITLGKFIGELPYQVYPSQLDGDPTGSYWLPMYFASWNGHSLVLPDDEAAQIYQNTNPSLKADPITGITGTGVTGPVHSQAGALYSATGLSTVLLYGNTYEFRVRLRDLSGGGAVNDAAVVPIDESPSNVASVHFKRYIAPHALQVLQPAPGDPVNNPVNSDQPINPDVLDIGRPLLGYPAVKYTGKYADAVASLIQASKDLAGVEAFGIEDPDVDQVEVTVEIESLRMDNLLSLSGKDNYVLLYKTRRRFSPVLSEADFKTRLQIPLVYKDCKVLHVGDELDLTADLQLADSIDNLQEIVLPTARGVRITLRGVCETKTNDASYYGSLNTNPDLDTRFGRIIQLRLFRPSNDESGLFLQSPPDAIRGIYLQPDPAPLVDGNFLSALFGSEATTSPTLIQRLAAQLGLESSGLTLMAAKGQRVQFGCSSRIRHTLSPESSSITFAANGDLMNHWLSCITLDLNRDWMWNSLAARSFIIERTTRFTHDLTTEATTEVVGDIEIRRTASFEALLDAHRDFTRIVFIDAVEPKNERMRPPPHNAEPRFPDSINVSYTVTPVMQNKDVAGVAPETILLDLPITTPPIQVPKIVSAGLALSPYRRNKSYSATEPRRRSLLIEFDEAILDPQDTYFARVLAYAPDQLISNNHPDLLLAPDEPALPLDPELIRVIPPPPDASTLPTNDLAGFSAMQPMEKAADSDRHYLMPLPPGLNADAAEMFGFFTYEFRVGHFKRGTQSGAEMSWTTAQGRFGRPLRATGVQHPAPALTAVANRNRFFLYVVAPYAAAVHDGKDVTAIPPRTQLSCLLYAQVEQADRRDFLNILLDDKRMDYRLQVDFNPASSIRAQYTAQQRTLLKNLSVANWKDEIDYAQSQHLFKLVDPSQNSSDAVQYGTAAWGANEVEQLLRNYGLPANSALSVLVVEVLPTITNLQEHVSRSDNRAVTDVLSSRLQTEIPQQSFTTSAAASVLEGPSGQLDEELGQHRILRTSPLTPVPYTC